MGGYAAYVWPAFAIATALLVGLMAASMGAVTAWLVASVFVFGRVLYLCVGLLGRRFCFVFRHKGLFLSL